MSARAEHEQGRPPAGGGAGRALRVDYLTTAAPWPEDTGGRLRVHALHASLLQHGFEVRLIVLGEKPDRASRARIRQAGGCVYPEWRGSLGVKLGRYLRGALRGHDPNAARLFNARRLERIARSVAERRSDVVLLGNVYLAPLMPALERLAPGARIVIDNHNVESLLHRRLAACGGRLGARLQAAVVARTSQRLEREYLHRATQVWACSDEDAGHLRGAYRLPAVHVVPNGVDTLAFDRADAGAEARAAIVFTGSFWYPPNQRAAAALMDVSERLRARGLEHTLLLVGQAPTPQMTRRARGRPGIVVTGAVPDVRPYLSGPAVFAAPLDSGSGTKLKLLQAMAMGLAVVTTSIGAEGLRLVDGTHALVARDRSAFEAQLARLLCSPDERARLGAAARAHVVRHFSLDAIARAVGEPLRELAEGGAA